MNDSNDLGAMNSLSDLFSAIETGDVQKLIQLIATGIDINACFRKGNSPLVMAIGLNQPAIVEALIMAGADVNKGDLYNFPIMIAQARSSGHVVITKLLIQQKADINLYTSYEAPRPRNRGLTALFYAIGCDARAVEECDPESVKLLLEAGADKSWNHPLKRLSCLQEGLLHYNPNILLMFREKLKEKIKKDKASVKDEMATVFELLALDTKAVAEVEASVEALDLKKNGLLLQDLMDLFNSESEIELSNEFEIAEEENLKKASKGSAPELKK